MKAHLMTKQITAKKAITVSEYRRQPLSTRVNWSPLVYTNAIPDEGYVFRILYAHLANCSARWSGTSTELVAHMNKLQNRRKRLLKEAIARLEKRP